MKLFIVQSLLNQMIHSFYFGSLCWKPLLPPCHLYFFSWRSSPDFLESQVVLRKNPRISKEHHRYSSSIESDHQLMPWESNIIIIHPSVNGLCDLRWIIVNQIVDKKWYLNSLIWFDDYWVSLIRHIKYFIFRKNFMMKEKTKRKGESESKWSQYYYLSTNVHIIFMNPIWSKLPSSKLI